MLFLLWVCNNQVIVCKKLVRAYTCLSGFLLLGVGGIWLPIRPRYCPLLVKHQLISPLCWIDCTYINSWLFSCRFVEQKGGYKLYITILSAVSKATLSMHLQKYHHLCGSSHTMVFRYTFEVSLSLFLKWFQIPVRFFCGQRYPHFKRSPTMSFLIVHKRVRS